MSILYLEETTRTGHLTASRHGPWVTAFGTGRVSPGLPSTNPSPPNQTQESPVLIQCPCTRHAFRCCRIERCHRVGPGWVLVLDVHGSDSTGALGV